MRFRTLVIRELVLATRIGGGGAMAVGFFLIGASLYPLGIGPELALLRRIAPGVMWVSALLACLLSLDRMFQADEEDGSLDLLLLSQFSPTGLVLTKVFSHWLSTGVPLIIAAPFVAQAFDLDYHAMITLMLSMLLGTPVLSLVGAVGAALTVGVRRGGMILSLLILPLYIPVLIFGAGSVEASLFGIGPQAHLIILLALLLLALALAPFAAAAALLLHIRA
ncbi:MAG TPA: heme exporter protein CcmB [Alphaproteobacteria bacterium]|jgi:heme exporter protein B|nr:heme exporter protein CcmB [Alphaproteobacteria bacterium]